MTHEMNKYIPHYYIHSYLKHVNTLTKITSHFTAHSSHTIFDFTKTT